MPAELYEYCHPHPFFVFASQKSLWRCVVETMKFKISETDHLTYFSPVFHFHTSWTRQKTENFLTFFKGYVNGTLGLDELTVTAWKVSKKGVFSGPYFPVFVLNMEIYGVNLRIQSEYRKIRTRKNSVFGHFSRSEPSTLLAHIIS